jgi:hypothetical protein
MNGLTCPVEAQNKATVTSWVVGIIFQQLTTQQYTFFDV